MKKLLTLAAILFGFSVISFAQIDNEHAIGLRMGGNDGFGTEISYQYTLTPMNRVQADLGLRSNNDWESWSLTGTYQWVWEIEEGLNWYAGFGGGIGSWDYKDEIPANDDSGTFLSVSGMVGLEYNFSIPLQLSIDTRPELGLINHRNNLINFDLALSARYRF